MNILLSVMCVEEGTSTVSCHFCFLKVTHLPTYLHIWMIFFGKTKDNISNLSHLFTIYIFKYIFKKV